MCETAHLSLCIFSFLLSRIHNELESRCSHVLSLLVQHFSICHLACCKKSQMVSLRHSCVHRSFFPRPELEEPVETQKTPRLSLLELSLLPVFLLPQLKPSSHLWALGAAPQFPYDLCPHYPLSRFLLPASLTSPWALGPPTR